MAINYATMMKTDHDVNIQVMNNSWGTRDPLDALHQAVAKTNEADILFVASAGNSWPSFNIDDPVQDFSYFPASYDLDNMLVVAATSQRDMLSYTSQWGPTSVDLAAPGVSIYSTLPGSRGFYGTDSGTSMAVPHVSGAAALLWSQLPDATVAEVRNALLQGVDSLPSLEGRVATGGRLNAHGALTVDTYAPRLVNANAENLV
ncbi:MAG: S8 family serine peptidase, partial [Planctomycetaceae bacterium]|nr:S8 family serine peptidase [Planctomycetaceae bacterium]